MVPEHVLAIKISFKNSQSHLIMNSPAIRFEFTIVTIVIDRQISYSFFSTKVSIFSIDFIELNLRLELDLLLSIEIGGT